MHKIWLVLKREYLTRVKSKSFIITTALTPLALIGLIAILVYVTISDTEVEKRIGIVDNTGVLVERLIEINDARYSDVSDVTEDTLRAQILDGDLDGFIVLNEEVITGSESPALVYGGSSGGFNFISSVRADLRDAVREEKLSRENVAPGLRDIFETQTGLDAVRLTEEGESEDNTLIASALGFILGLMIFMGIFIYGTLLMRSVIEEKTNRVLEVIASSVKPIELMFGKLFGVLGMALTQFGIWIGCYIGLSIAAAPIAGMIMGTQLENLPAEATQAASSFDPASLEQLVVDPMVFVHFLIFFFLGFLIYSAVFAAIGAAVESEQDSQQFLLPVGLPIFIGYFLNTRVMEAPDSPLSLFVSLFPLTAPINMITRIAASQVPAWQIVVSILLMILTFFGVMWLAAKIYRVGILMYGKKPGFKELAKWIKQS